MNTYAGNREDLGNAGKLRLRNRFALPHPTGIADVDKIDMGVRSHRDEIGLLRVPFHRV